MDRRMYRGSTGTRNVPLRSKEPVCSDMGGYTPDDSCERDNYEGDFNRYPIGMCYVPWQKFRNLFENEFVALDKGTLFKELHLEWYGRSCK